MIEFTDDYKKVFKAIENKEPFVFVTGSGGTGKSTLIHEIAKGDNVIVTSSTGLSALNVGGITLHSLFGLPPTIVSEDQVRLDRNYDILEGVEVLIIDEISMIRGDILDAVNYGLQVVKQNNEPFGGITVIGVGDLFQLPPVTDKKDMGILKKMGYDSAFFFDAYCLQNIEYRIIQLSKIFRQKDNDFKEILEDLRYGKNKDGIIKFLNTKVNNECNSVTLCTRNVDVSHMNATELSKLPSPIVKFRCQSTGKKPDNKNLPAPEILEIKVGAKVMLTKNHENGDYVNGTTGVVKRIENGVVWVQTSNLLLKIECATWKNIGYHLKEGRINTIVLGTYKQLPMILAFAITIHKAQGKTIDKLTLDLGRGAFAPGQTYCAVSRLTSFDGLSLKRPIERRDIIVDRKCLRYMQV